MGWLWIVCSLVPSQFSWLPSGLADHPVRVGGAPRALAPPSKAQFKLVRTEDDPEEFAASVERDLAQLPTTNERDRDLS